MSTYPCSRHSGYSAEIQDHAICCLAISVLSAAFSHFPPKPLSPPFLHAANLCLRPLSLSLSRTSGRRIVGWLPSIPFSARAEIVKIKLHRPSIPSSPPSGRTFVLTPVWSFRASPMPSFRVGEAGGGERNRRLSGAGGMRPNLDANINKKRALLLAMMQVYVAKAATLNATSRK